MHIQNLCPILYLSKISVENLTMSRKNFRQNMIISFKINSFKILHYVFTYYYKINDKTLFFMDTNVECFRHRTKWKR